MPVIEEAVLVRPTDMDVPLPRLCSAIRGGDVKYLKDTLGGATPEEMKVKYPDIHTMHKKGGMWEADYRELVFVGVLIPLST